MNDRDVLEKSINKPPLFCRIGWHKWRISRVDQLPVTNRVLVSYACQRPGCLERTTEARFLTS